MKKSPLLILVLGCMPIHSLAQHSTDSLKQVTNLKEVVVEGANQELKGGTALYKPLRNQKNAARNGMDLLRLMAIPQLEVTPQSSDIHTINGQTVRTFIDMQPASATDIATLNPRDVKEVQYFTSPTDPRFEGAPYAVNFVMNRYEYGGYSRLDVSDNYVGKWTNDLNGALVSKMVYKSMTYDFIATGDAGWSHHFGTDNEAVYKLRHGGEIDRLEKGETRKERTYGFQTAFRAIYRSNKMSVSNQVGFLRKGNPYSDISGQVSMNDLALSFGRHDSSQNYMPFWKGNFYFMLPKNFMLNVSTDFIYSRGDNWTLYDREDAHGYDYAVKEDLYEGKANVSLTKQFSRTQATVLNIVYGIVHSTDTYSGSTSAVSRLNLQYGALGLKHAGMFNKVYASLSAGVSFEANSIDHINNTSWKPYASVTAQYTPTRKSQFAAEVNYSTNVPPGSMKSTAMVEANELMWLTGNPSLKSVNQVYASLNYTWLPTNYFYGSVFANYSGSYKRAVRLYTPTEHGVGMIRNYINNGDYQVMTFGVTGNLKLLKNSLQLSASPRVSYFKSTGIYSLDQASFYMNLNAAYYIKDFYFSAYYSPEWRNVGEDGMKNHYKDYLSITAGWSKDAWNISLTANNLFRDNWINRTSLLTGEYYQEYITSFSTNRHRGFTIDVSYTIGYGKKVKHNNELQPAQGVESTRVK